MSMRTVLTDLLEIELPILLAPMGGVAGGELAAAVSAAGGLGLIGGGYADPAAGYGGADWLEREFAVAGKRRVGVGFITWSLALHPERLTQALAHRPAAIMLSFGDPAPFVDEIKAAGSTLICQVQTAADAHAATAAGADVIVAQGTEAGGHGAERATFTLVPAVVDAVAPVPVVAAGGVADGRGLAAALALGAAGVLVGTRFFAAEEALGHEAAKARIVEADGDRTRRTRVFDIVRGLPWPARFTGRAIVNDFLARWHDDEAGLEAALPGENDRYRAAADAGDVDTAVIFAGESVDLIHDVAPAGALVRRTVAEAEAALAAAAPGRRS